MRLNIKIDTVNNRIGFIESFKFKYRTNSKGFEALVGLRKDGTLCPPNFYFSEEFVPCAEKVAELGTAGLDRYINAHKATHSLLFGPDSGMPVKLSVYRLNDTGVVTIFLDLLKPLGTITSPGIYPTKLAKANESVIDLVRRSNPQLSEQVVDRKSFVAYRLGMGA